MSLRIRKALPEDIQAIVDIAVEAFWKEYGNIEEARKAFRGPVARRWKHMIEDKTAIVLVAEKDKQVIGFLVFRWWFGWNGWLEAIAVKKEYRGMGIGTLLMRALIERARRIGYTRICFAVRQNEEVIKFYRKFNAQRFGELPDEDVGKLILYFIHIGESI